MATTLLYVAFAVLACTWSVEGMSNVYYTNDGTVYCDQCPSGTRTYTERRVITRPAQTYSLPYYTVQGRVVNSGSTDNTITQQTYYSTNDENGGTVDSQGCSRNPCGTNAICQETVGGRPVCSCPSGHSGNPTTYCRRAECLDHSECRGDMACRSGSCVNPCAGTCGTNANCEVRNHVAVCSCPGGYKGDPFSYCRRADPEELCHPSPCGQNTKCSAQNGVPTCSCLPGYTGSPLSGCRHECESDGECGSQEFCKDFRCQSSCSQCGDGATCVRTTNHRAVCECPKGYIGSAYTECRPECYGDVDCPSNRPACFYGVCKNTCDGACGVGADCNLRGLTPVCSCPRDMTGDPFISCRPFTKADLCEPNPCGTNAQCVPGHDNTGRERPVCTCFAGYTGNPLSYCARGECQTDSECSDNRSCLNYQCVNPCVGQCGAGATCEARRHLAVCKCPHGTDGDALVSCRQSRKYPVARYHRK
ncbi:neurogenic locus notch homolog protein 1-like isoform X1 [Bradysia coprophila]|uniref:neurogenic locus notch homolog protein 1-like isoform X1 n=1 Tax=Bradysia coprophila TaxID=38358 RepID=UPI00187DC7DD|nr:neurogenic locus notch homolog protein 1-like isoform X1 [Bradysia coprophila]